MIPSNKFRRRSLRLKDFDYSQGAFFVTVCSAGRASLLGEVIQGEMQLSEAGMIVEQEWLNTAVLRPNIELDQFVVMPNHLHGIVVFREGPGGTARCAPTEAKFGQSVANSLSTIIRAFKSAATNRVNRWKNLPEGQVWQRGFYEHVIRDDNALNRIREYIVLNPELWDSDRDNPKCSKENDFYVWLSSFMQKPTRILK
jgi:REP element-mobilizing transposase RayT